MQRSGFRSIKGVPFFGLPGNPTSTYVGFEIFVRPVIRRMLGHQQVFRPLIPARLTHPVRAEPGVPAAPAR